MFDMLYLGLWLPKSNGSSNLILETRIKRSESRSTGFHKGGGGQIFSGYPYSLHKGNHVFLGKGESNRPNPPKFATGIGECNLVWCLETAAGHGCIEKCSIRIATYSSRGDIRRWWSLARLLFRVIEMMLYYNSSFVAVNIKNGNFSGAILSGPLYRGLLWRIKPIVSRVKLSVWQVLIRFDVDWRARKNAYLLIKICEYNIT